jgi:thioredoxin-related protein
MKKMTVLLSIIIAFGFNMRSHAQQTTTTEPTAKIKWLDIEEAVALNKKKPKMFFIDTFTDWCGWCKKMDATTFQNPVIVEYMNKNFYAVKFNAERKDTVNFNGKQYVNPNPTGQRATHQLAQELLGGRMSYPSFVILDENLAKVTIIPGYRKAPDFESILHFFGDKVYVTNPDFSTFDASFQRTATE